jgi:hypothetical protein
MRSNDIFQPNETDFSGRENFAVGDVDAAMAALAVDKFIVSYNRFQSAFRAKILVLSQFER